MAPTQKVSKPQGTPTKRSRATSATEHAEQDLIFLWVYFKQAELPAGAHQSVAKAWGITKNCAYKRFNRLKETLEMKEKLRQQVTEELEAASEEQGVEELMKEPKKEAEDDA